MPSSPSRQRSRTTTCSAVLADGSSDPSERRAVRSSITTARSRICTRSGSSSVRARSAASALAPPDLPSASTSARCTSSRLSVPSAPRSTSSLFASCIFPSARAAALRVRGSASASAPRSASRAPSCSATRPISSIRRWRAGLCGRAFTIDATRGAPSGARARSTSFASSSVAVPRSARRGPTSFRPGVNPFERILARRGWSVIG